MDILLRNTGGQPIYEQIADQIKGQILDGSLAAGTALPSIRLLARDLRISVITTKRAYEDLERDGFITTVVGKGSFVASTDSEFLREEQLRTAEAHLTQAVRAARLGGIDIEELVEVLRMLYEEE